MNITKQYVAGLIALLKSEYPREFREMTEKQFAAKIEMWHNSLEKYPKEVVDAAFRRALETSTYPPALANILGNVKEIQKALEPTDTEFWEMLLTATRRATERVRSFHYTFVEANGLTQGQNARNEFKAIWAEMPQVLKDYCGNENGLISLTRLGNEELAFEKGRFLKMLPTLKTRAEVRRTVHPDILKLASGTFKEIGSSAAQMTLTGTKE